jgi:predicted nucleotidyltransferase component of viral defense system
LKALADRIGEGFNPLLDRYVAFRLLHRLSASRFADRFYVKGATMFLIWMGTMHRPTRDIDLLGLTAQDENDLRDAFRELCAIECPEDGVIFDPETVRAEAIREEQTYGGIRIKLVGYIGKAKIPLQVDVGFGDAVTPAAPDIELPGIIGGIPAIKLKGYPVETAIAEKLQAMVALGLGNGRMKDFLDVARLAEAMRFDGATLARAIRATFDRRRTKIPTDIPLALTAEFYSDGLVTARWRAFVARNSVQPPYDSLGFVSARILKLVLLPLQAVYSGTAFEAAWRDGAWSSCSGS